MKFDSIQIHSAPVALVQPIAEQIENGTLAQGGCLPSQRKLARLFFTKPPGLVGDRLRRETVNG